MGSNLINTPMNGRTPTASLLTVNFLLNSVVLPQSKVSVTQSERRHDQEDKEVSQLHGFAPGFKFDFQC